MENKPTYEELQAQVEALRQVINEYKKCRVSAQLAINEIVHRDSKTPQQHLAEIRAQAGRDGFIAGCRYVCDPDGDEWLSNNYEQGANQYAASIRLDGGA